MSRMMIKGLGVLITVFLSVSTAWSQAVTTMQRTNVPGNANSDLDYGRAFRFNVKSDGVKGTPFLFEEPKSATIALSGGKVYDDIPFNIYPENEEVFIQTGGDDSDPLILKNWEWLKTIEEQPQLFRLEYLEGKQRIVEVLYEKDRDKYVALHSKHLVKPTTLKDGYTGPQYDVFKTNIRYFKINGLKSTEIKTNNSGIKELAQGQFSQVRAFMKAEKLKPEQTADMKRILEFLFD
ncbi:hypothetical protein [Cecembia lonarensis]|uniref:Uncharacterized protein n=1 Tax=Cecembia lonarensis (strain CCUG 58316 / KCTC 22772 / LW9) TaxID=1225176 RepID=K1L264_CECL9|nr:hypothetical protein [Cecembia lonarensis]EKB48856.1 hypothetical protein B879_02498 [Cecembia lonarensis LW9]